MNLTRHVDVEAPPETVFAAATDWDRQSEAATFEWTEQLELPLGVLGRAGWPLVRPLFGWGLRLSLDRFAAFCRTYPR